MSNLLSKLKGTTTNGPTNPSGVVSFFARYAGQLSSEASPSTEPAQVEGDPSNGSGDGPIGPRESAPAVPGMSPAPRPDSLTDRLARLVSSREPNLRPETSEGGPDLVGEEATEEGGDGGETTDGVSPDEPAHPDWHGQAFGMLPDESPDAYLLRLQSSFGHLLPNAEGGRRGTVSPAGGLLPHVSAPKGVAKGGRRRAVQRSASGPKASDGSGVPALSGAELLAKLEAERLQMVGRTEVPVEQPILSLAGESTLEDSDGALVQRPGKLATIVDCWWPPIQEEEGLLEPEEFEQAYELLPVPGTSTGRGSDTVGVASDESFLLPVESLVARMGAKSQLRDWLVRNFPKSHTYVEPFGGSFKVLLWKPYRSRVEIINDVDCDLVHFFRYAAFDPVRLVEAINSVPTHEAIILGMREGLGRKDYSGLERAVACYISLAASFNGMVGGNRYASSPFTLLRTGIDLRSVQAVAKRLRGVDIRARSFDYIIESANKELPADKYPPGGVFFYLDPPYWGTTGYKTHSGEGGFGWTEQERLARYCWEIDQKGNKFIQTNSDHPDLIGLYGGFKRPDGSPAFLVERREVYYSVAGKAANREEAGEFIISNFPLRKQREENKRQRNIFDLE